MKSGFEKLALLGAFLAKDYSKDLLRLLYLYKDISASEAASRLGMHIKTVQDSLDALFESDIVEKSEVFENKRPYYRFTLKKNIIDLQFDISHLVPEERDIKGKPAAIREKRNANARYSTARNKLFFSSVTIWSGKGRNTDEKKISLTTAQGKFLFNLPFPNAEYLTIHEIMTKANIDTEYEQEILDIVKLLIDYNVIEVKI